MRPLRDRKRFFAVPLLGAAALLLGAPGLGARQEAQAAQWQLYLSNNGAYCTGCCASGSLCCSINFPCSVPAPDTPPGGG